MIETVATLFKLILFIKLAHTNPIFCESAIIFKHFALVYILFSRSHVNTSAISIICAMK